MAEDGAGGAGAELRPAILHVDMDAFFASVEVLDHPELAGLPVIVGGGGARGVVASCTYEARAFGVHSAMPSLRARQLCPDAVFVDGHYGRYAEVSAALAAILTGVTPLVEPIGLDEAFLDVTGARRLLGGPERIAFDLRRRVADELSLPCAIGVGRTKLVAKLASRAAKPRPRRQGVEPGPGVVVVAPDQELEFLHRHPVGALWGVGPATAARLHALGVRTVGDLARLPADAVVRRLGRAHGLHLVALARGEDPSPVVPDRAAKSIGHEETFAHDLFDHATVARHVVRMSQSVAGHLRGSSTVARTVTLKVKYADFSLVTRSHTLSAPIDTPQAIAAVAGALAEAVDLSPGVRLLGVSVSQLGPASTTEQMRLDLDGAADPASPPEVQSGWSEVSAAVDAVRSRYGTTAVGTAAMLTDDGIDVPARRQSPWGPAADPGDGDPAD